MITPLKSQDPAWLLLRANALVFQRGEVLADFERALIAEAFRRVARGDGVLTPAERQVVEDAVEAMIKAGRQDLTAAGIAA